ncbi:EamA/RhaT family transporter [Achromobacter sp. GG226]|uniref:EamA/RhaT family transporter n=1 Tax=Verticiella alkaliphila TaxID=2779529 RepID=UPI001C0E6EF4|nr:EamA/RhaT family transporter [Verticiella sp. GG226]MBU4611553.1 EamA/RhaT family transporter [Verticiella sp. GG226]
MFYLVASITCSVAVSVLLKLFRRHGIDPGQAICVNYAVALTMTLLLLQPSMASLQAPATPWAVLIVLGVLLPSVFLAMAASVRHAGIVRSDAAQRLSLFIPLLAAFFLFGQEPTLRTVGGIALALAALFCLLKRHVDTPAEGGTYAWLWPLAVWLGYGVIDILFKQMSKAGTAFPAGLAASFTLAGVMMLAYLLLRRTVWARRNLVAGMLLGLLNFGNILFYIRAHQQFPQDPALVFSAMNIGVVGLGALIGAWAFREPLSKINLLGLALTFVAIAVMIPRG